LIQKFSKSQKLSTYVNISQFCENALMEAIKRLKDMYQPKNSKNNSWSLGRDLNPRPPPYQAKPPAGFCTSSNQTIDWKLFEKWLFKEYRKRTAKDRLRYAKRYYRCLQGDLKPLMVLDGDKRLHAMKALSALSKFLGAYDQWRSLVRNYGLKWSNGKTDDLIIARFTKTQNSDDIVEWIKKIKAIIPNYALFTDLVAATGLRLEEAVNCWNLIIRLSSDERLSEYYKAENCILEHFRYKRLFIRRTKKAFISFIDQDLVMQIAESNPLTKNQITKRIQRRKINLRFGDVREFWASYMTKHLYQPEIDFLQGRVSSSVFMRNYFNPVWIRDLKERALKGEEEILKQIRQS